ncbi:hypothetical protein ACTU44_10365 [Thalassospira sp. SM2505]
MSKGSAYFERCLLVLMRVARDSRLRGNDGLGWWRCGDGGGLCRSD